TVVLCLGGVAICWNYQRLSGWIALPAIGFLIWCVTPIAAHLLGMGLYADAIDFVLITAVVEGFGFLLGSLLIIVGFWKTARKVRAEEEMYRLRKTTMQAASERFQPDVEGSDGIRTE